MKRAIIILVVLAILGIVISDAYRYSTAQQALRSATYDLATWAAQNAPRMSRDQVAGQLAAMGTQRGVVVYQYGQSGQGIQIWTRSTVPDTYVAGTIVNVFKGVALSEALDEPLVIQDYREAGMQ